MKVLHTLGALNHSGAERMLACSYGEWQMRGVEPIVIGMSDQGHPYADRLADAGYDTRLLPDIRSPRGALGLVRTIRTLRPEIVHIHAERCFDVAALAAATAESVRGIVRTVHSDFRPIRSVRTRRRARMALALKMGVVWVACSREVAETEASYLRGRAPRLVENWIDVEAITREATLEARGAVRAELEVPADASLVALIGNCGGAKNHELIARSLTHVQGGIHLLHAGSQVHVSAAETDAWEAVPPRHTIHHLGERDDVPKLLAASDLVVLPSLYEGMGLVAAEALCAGVPILASDTRGIQWLAEMPSARLIALDQRAWATAVAEALASPEGSKRIQTAATLAKARFTPARGVAEYVNIYAEALLPRERDT